MGSAAAVVELVGVASPSQGVPVAPEGGGGGAHVPLRPQRLFFRRRPPHSALFAHASRHRLFVVVGEVGGRMASLVAAAAEGRRRPSGRLRGAAPRHAATRPDGAEENAELKQQQRHHDPAPVRPLQTEPLLQPLQATLKTHIHIFLKDIFY